MKNVSLSRLSPLAQPFTSKRFNHFDSNPPPFDLSLDNPNAQFSSSFNGSSFDFDNFVTNSDFNDIFNTSSMDFNGGAFAQQGKPAIEETIEHDKDSRPSSSITTISPHYPVCPKNMNFSGKDAMWEPLLLKAQNQLVSAENMHTEEGRGRDRKDDNTVSREAVDTFVKASTELPVICPSVHVDATIKPRDNEASVPGESSSGAHDDSDLDSPCWKGTQVHQTTSSVYEPPVGQLLEAKATNSLNPQAPQFYPGCSKRIEYCHEHEAAKNNLPSLPRISSLAVSSSIRENCTVDSSKARACSAEVSAVTGTQLILKHVHELQKGAEHIEPGWSSLLGASGNTQPSIIDNYSRSDSQPVTGSVSIGSVKLVGDTPMESLTCEFCPRTKNCMVPSFSGVDDSSNFTEKVFGGTQTTTRKIDIRRASSDVYESVGGQWKNGAEVAIGLNPLAPQFQPGSGKWHANNREKKQTMNHSLSFQKTASSTFAPKGKGKCPSEVSDASGTHFLKHFPELETSISCSGPTQSSHLCSSFSIEPPLVKDHYASDFRSGVFTGAGALKGIKNAGLDILTGLLSSDSDNVTNSFFSGVGDSSEHTRILSGASKCTTSKMNAQLLINAMCDLSEQLVQNCSNELHSLNEQQRKKMEHIISNLFMCTKNNTRPLKTTIPGPSNQRPSSDLVKLADCNKPSMGLQVTRMNSSTIPQSHEWQKKRSSISSGKLWHPVSSSSEGIGFNNDITGVVTCTWNQCREIEEDMSPRAILYKKLWLEAEEAMCYMKYQLGQMQIKQQTRLESIDDDGDLSLNRWGRW